MKSIVFDLDLTLVDSSIAEVYRSKRKWQDVYRVIPQFIVYDGLDEVFDFIRMNNLKVCIVSTAPSTYVRKTLEYFEIPYNYIVGYHDAKPIKPHPAPMLKALELLREEPGNAISFGDRAIDIQSSNAAGIKSVACLWGTKEKTTLLHSGYNHAIIDPSDILTLIR